MLRFKNDYDDREVTLTTRDMITGRDVTSVTVAAGEEGEIELNGDYQVSVSTRARLPGELPLDSAPVARPLSEGETTAEAANLTTASDEDVRAEINDMVTNKTDLTGAGAPNLQALNTRLAALNFEPIGAARRDALMPQPA